MIETIKEDKGDDIEEEYYDEDDTQDEDLTFDELLQKYSDYYQVLSKKEKQLKKRSLIDPDTSKLLIMLDQVVVQKKEEKIKAKIAAKQLKDKRKASILKAQQDSQFVDAKRTSNMTSNSTISAPMGNVPVTGLESLD